MRRRTLISAALAQACAAPHALGREERGTTSAAGPTASILVPDGELATARNRRTGITYGPAQIGARRHIQQAVVEARDGDTIEISPGAIWAPWIGDGSTYLEPGMLHVWKSLTITNVPGKGPWRLAPPWLANPNGWSGIVVREPSQTFSNPGDSDRGQPRKTIVIEGFEADNWGRQAGNFGVRIRNDPGAGSWDRAHASVTLRGFSIGKRRYDASASGVAGMAENLLFESGHVFDTGGATGAGEGQDHNFYVSARQLTFRGVRASRSRGLATGSMDGHIIKAAAVRTLIEGCAIDCGPNGDNSFNLHCRAGGHLILRGCLFIGGANTGNRSTGVIGYENEATQTPWFYGAEGHSLLIEKNVLISHFGRPLVYFRPEGHAWRVNGVSSVVIRDNIGMCAASPTTTPRFGEAMWIRNDPTHGPPWSVQNSVMPYGPDEPGFDGKATLAYRRSAGPIRASRTVSTYRFQWPHGFVERTDDHQGLG